MCPASICSSSLGVVSQCHSSLRIVTGEGARLPSHSSPFLQSTPCQALPCADADGMAGGVGQGPGGAEPLPSVQRWTGLPGFSLLLHPPCLLSFQAREVLLSPKASTQLTLVPRTFHFNKELRRE